MRQLYWLLAAVCVALAVYGFGRGGTAGAATLGFPGSSAAIFFIALARAASMDRRQVAELGSWMLYGSGSVLAAGALLGLSTLVRPGAGLAALTLAILGDPVLAIASLRLSTGSPRKGTWYALAAASMAVGMTGAMLLARLSPSTMGQVSD